MIFEDWELIEEYFIAKGILAPLKSEDGEDASEINSQQSDKIKAFRMISPG